MSPQELGDRRYFYVVLQIAIALTVAPPVGVVNTALLPPFVAEPLPERALLIITRHVVVSTGPFSVVTTPIRSVFGAVAAIV
jgi:hypothetical protein